MKDDDDEDDNTFGVTRYPCMPSLVALQQMRNRLHLAFLGRKLMKWTMMATGRELRKLAMELDDIYHTYADDMRNAFILLARCRYFYPNLNKMVIEDVPRKAGAVVIPITKSIHGVKILSHELRETEAKPYLHLGIEKGGQTILETKKAWLELLRRIILMIQLRTNFEMVEAANKAATKKQNVLSKIVIPKTHLTMSYIDSELDELAREEFFRLKKVLDIKRKLRAGKDQKPPVDDKPRKRKATRRIPEPEEEVDPEKCVVCGTVIKEEPMTEEEKAQQEQKLEELKAQISEIMEMTKGLTQEGILATNVNEFLRTAEELKENIDAPEELDFEGIDFEAELEELCLDCRTKYIEEYKRRAAEEAAAEPPVPAESSHVEFTLKEPSKDTIKSAKTPQPGTSDVYSEIQPDVELGTFETEEKEIIKVMRIKNDDGTVSEQKKVIKIKREVKTPVRGKSAASNNPTNQPSQTSGKSNPYSGSKTVGHYTTIVNSGENNYGRDASQMRVRSLPITPTSQMSEPVERFCMSSFTLLSTDLDVGVNSSSDEYISITLNNSPPIMPKYTYAQYNCNKPQSYTSLNISSSEKILFDRIYTKSNTATKSQSYNEVSKTKGQRKKLKQSVSFFSKETKSDDSL